MNNFSEKLSFSKVAIILALLCGFFLVTQWAPWQDREIALDLGEPWEEMRQRSTARIGPAIDGYSWFQMPSSDARLRLVDPQYGFVTPIARSFTIGFDDEYNIENVRLSPQVEPLSLDETLKVVIELQNQWLSAGWEPYYPGEFPALADTPQWREHLEERRGVTYWRGGSKYMVRLYISRFFSQKYDEQRYLVTMQLSRPNPD